MKKRGSWRTGLRAEYGGEGGGPRGVKMKTACESDKDTRYMMSLVCEIQKKTHEIIYKTETDSQTKKTDLGLPKGAE